MNLVFDEYDWKARLAPAFIVSLPLITTLVSCFDWPGPTLSKILGGAIWLILIYALTIPVRNAGSKIEPELWKKWGGPPSTVVMRWSNLRMGRELKKQCHDAVKDYLMLPMPSEGDERANTKNSDEMIAQAFKRVRGVLREEDPKGLWTTENANYGFHRNLLGSRKLWLVLSIAGVVVSGVYSLATQDKVVISGFAGNIIILLLCFYLGWYVVPGGIEHVAYRYADCAWESFLNIVQKKGKA
jgi:hypothetical protein